MNSKRPAVPQSELRVVRVLPDITGMAKEFDYTIPREWDLDGRGETIQVGTRVRIRLQGRRVAGWVTAVDVEPVEDVSMRSVAKLSGYGPSSEIVDLSRWIADRWVGHPAKILRSASPPRNVDRLRKPGIVRVESATGWLDQAFTGPGAVVRIGPAGDRWPVIEAALSLGNPLIVAPSLVTVDRLVQRLRRQRIRVARLPDDWATAASGAVVVGTRPAVVGPAYQPGAIVILDEHDESLQEERTPTWHAREVALERAKRVGIPCVLVSPTPTLEALEALPLITTSRDVEFEAWPEVVAIDRRDEPPGQLGLFSKALVRELRMEDRRIACVVNRKGRARLLACASCGEITACEHCSGAVRQNDSTSFLDCGRCGKSRPVICQSCGATKLKNIRMGVTRAREELAALVNEEVAEVTASGREGSDDARVVVGTEAVLHGRDRFDTVAFLDFDQELRATRQRASEQALGLLARAARKVGPRKGGGRVLVQTRSPDDAVVVAARRADPGVVASADRERRQAMGWPPYVAQASISGAGAPAFMASLGTPLGLTVIGPSDDRWLVRAADADVLSAELASVARPAERLRIEIDPRRL